MKQIFFLIGALILTACSGRGAGGDDSRTADAASRMTRADFEAYLKALQAHDYDGFTSFYTEDFKAHSNTPGLGTLDRAGTINMERDIAEHFNWTIKVRQLVMDDEGIALHATLSGPIIKDWPGPGVKTGQTMETHFVSLYKLRGNKIAELWIVTYQPQ